jgi:hypothetical protein
LYRLSAKYNSVHQGGRGGGSTRLAPGSCQEMTPPQCHSQASKPLANTEKHDATAFNAKRSGVAEMRGPSKPALEPQSRPQRKARRRNGDLAFVPNNSRGLRYFRVRSPSRAGSGLAGANAASSHSHAPSSKRGGASYCPRYGSSAAAGAYTIYTRYCFAYGYIGSLNGPIQRPKPDRYVQYEFYEATARSKTPNTRNWPVCDPRALLRLKNMALKVVKMGT